MAAYYQIIQSINQSFNHSINQSVKTKCKQIINQTTCVYHNYKTVKTFINS